MAAIYLLNVPEFRPIAEAARQQGCTVTELKSGYLRITQQRSLEIRRKPSGVKLPVWFGAPTGGIEGAIDQFDREVLRVVDR
jgi:hypothetical protein